MKQIITLSILFLLIISIPETVFAQRHGNLKGVVKDANSGEAMFSATVHLDGTSIGDVTDMKGKYIITSIPPGQYTLRVEYLGYADFEKQITIEAGQDYTENINLEFSGGVQLEGVTITAQAEGQMQAINQQLQSDDIMNVVSSDRIRELPSANAAESLGRLPGVSLQRSGGEGNKVIIRGMSPKYNKVMMDGVDLAGTDRNDRSVGLSGISSYSLDGIEVIKSARSDMEADFVGGAVNFKLRSAPVGLNAELMAQGTYNNLKTDFSNYNFMGNVSMRFFENKFGFFIMLQTEKVNRSANTKYISAEARSFDEENPDFVHYNLTLQDELRIVKRNNATLVLDYNLKNGNIIFKNFLSQRNIHNEFYSERFPTRDGGGDVFAEVRDLTTDQLMYVNNLTYMQQFGRFILDATAAHSYTQSDNPNDLRFNFRQAKTGDGSPVTENIPQDINPNDALDYSNADYHYLGFSSIALTPNYTKSRLIQGKVNLEWEFNVSEKFGGSLKAGGMYRHQERSYDFDIWTGNFGAAGNELGRDYYNDNQELFEPGDIDETTKEILYPYFVDPNKKVDKYLDGQFGPFLPRVDIDKLHDVADYMIYDYYAIPENQQKDVVMHNAYQERTYDYNGNEDYAAAYLMGTFNFGRMWTLIPGVRYEQMNTEYTGTKGRSDLSGPNYYRYVDARDTTTYRNNSFVLPNIRLIVKPLNWLQFHLAYTHTLQRPNYSLIIPREDISDGANNRYIINNTQLEPELAKNFDFVTSFHENHLGLFSVNLFYKNIENKIFSDFSQPVAGKWEEFGLPEVFQGLNYSWNYNDTIGVRLVGIELDWQTSFWYAPGFLKGFTFSINYTYIKSTATYPDGHTESIDHDNNPFTPDSTIVFNTPYEARLIEQPTNIVNISLGYDIKGFSIRASMQYTDNIFRGTSFKPADRAFTGSYLRFDLSATQRLPKGFIIYANLNNINNAQELDYKQGSIGHYATRLENYGFTIDLGLRWIFSSNK